ncbi:MAG: DGQHR domain-containing protein [Micrococcales bacterium]|nr:DGQHR domain-containing protein [Micrococcales bacterium]
MTTSSETLKRVTTSKDLVLSGALAVQRGVPMMQTFGRATEVVERSKADTYDPVQKTGYQRDRQMPRVRKAAEYYRSGGRMPNPLLVNLREADLTRIEVRIISGDKAAYDEAVENGGDWIGVAELVIPQGVTIWVFDGQHREGAVEELLDGGDFGEFPVPLSITIGLDTAEEMKEFYEVNQNAKAVKTDLAWELLRLMAEEDPELAELLEIKGQDWKTRGADVTDELIDLGGVWAESIQSANVRKLPSDRLTLNKAQFIRSLQPVLAMPALSKAPAKDIARILHAYWNGIARVMPEPFDPANDPKKWVIQKGPGAIAFHRVLPQIIEVLRAKGLRLADPEAYADVLKELPTLSGEIVYEDGSAAMVSGADFWRAGPEGVASQWTGDAGRKRLAVRIQALLPRPSEALAL